MTLAYIHLTLADERKRKQIEQKEIAKALGLDPSTISLYEKGKRGIPLKILDKWLYLLDLEVELIFK